MRNSFIKNTLVQKSYHENGYAKLQFLNKQELHELLSFYEEIKNDLAYHSGLHISMEMAGEELGLLIKNKIKEIIESALKRSFKNYKVFQGSFIIKKKNEENNSIGVHQDWVFVDEEGGYTSATLWIALSDIVKKNGSVGFLPGSHNDFNFRFVPMQVCETPYSDVQEELAETLIIEELKKGEALIWDHRVLHGSLPNLSEEDRLVSSIAITHADAPMQMVYKLPNDEKIGIFPIDVDFMNNYNSHKIYGDYKLGINLGGKEPIKLLNPKSMPKKHELMNYLVKYQKHKSSKP